MEYFAVIDTETTWSNEVMSIGVVIADVDNMIPICAECYIIDPTYKEGGMYSSVLLAHGKKNTYLDTRKGCLDGVEGILRMIGPDKSYCETHNAYLDAIDELSIVRLLNLDLDVYDVAIL